jgi:hemerythrin-like domain-containing protein
MRNHEHNHNTRRRFIIGAATATLPVLATNAHAQKTANARATANEDLMHEHGLVTRVMLIYGRAISLLNENQNIDPALIGGAAQIMARVIHGHHEQEEEQILFPVVEKRQELSNLVQTLRGQHSAARGITATIGNNLTRARLQDQARRRELINAMQNFINMYEPHGAYEDTVIYPAFRNALSAAEYDKVSERFAANERQINGDDGLAKIVRQLSDIEGALGVDLARYTRQMTPPGLDNHTETKK